MLEVSSALRPAAYISNVTGVGGIRSATCWTVYHVERGWERWGLRGGVSWQRLSLAGLTRQNGARWNPERTTRTAAERVSPSRTDSKPKSLKYVLGKTFLKMHVDKTVREESKQIHNSKNQGIESFSRDLCPNIITATALPDQDMLVSTCLHRAGPMLQTKVT